MKHYTKSTKKPYSFLIIDAALASENPLRFRKKSFMTIDDKIRDEKLQYDINREAAKISALSSGKIGKCEYLTGEEILPSDQSRLTGRKKFTNSPLGKEFSKQIKKIEDQGEK